VSRRRFPCRWLAGLLAAGLFIVSAPPRASAQAGDAPAGVKSAQQIEQALERPKTRGLVVLPAQSEQRAAASGEAVGAAVDLNVPFAFNSSELLPQADEQLRALQSALASGGLKSDRFLVAGHTDGVGSAPYNRALSLRRAEAVKRFLVKRGIAPERLQTTGYGADRLLRPDRPDDAANRRVEIRNLGDRS
jgi:outer membrane protein OmpA-like peptidoglycan-associated protein